MFVMPFMDDLFFNYIHNLTQIYRNFLSLHSDIVKTALIDVKGSSQKIGQ